MIVALVITLAVAGIIFLFPWRLHADSQEFYQQVVVFRCSLWHHAILLLRAIGVAGLASIPAPAAALCGRPFLALLLLVPTWKLARYAFVVARLHLTYWCHERYATLAISRPGQVGTYTNTGLTIHFALADVLAITRYVDIEADAPPRRQPSKGYSYQVWTLRDGRTFLITNLVSGFFAPDGLVPHVRRSRVRLKVCWLPDLCPIA